MSTSLAIEHLHGSRRKPLATAATFRVVEHTPPLTIVTDRSKRGTGWRVGAVLVAIAGVVLVGWIAAGTFPLGQAIFAQAEVGEPPAPATATTSSAQPVGAFTGSYERGLPVYRLPPVKVTAHLVTDVDSGHNAPLDRTPRP